MKRIFARIGFVVEVTDSEWQTLREKYGREQDISQEDIEKIIKRGDPTGDSYMPQDTFDYPEEWGLA